jgi:hypothetical protein
MKTLARMCFTVISVFLLVTCSLGQDPNLKAATYAAQQWLALIDAGRYAESWDSAAQFFQQKINREQWGEAMTSFRAPLGKLLSRQMMNASYETNLPEAPAGKYYVIQFRTTLTDYSTFIETVNMMQEPNGQWRVSGYRPKRAEETSGLSKHSLTTVAAGSTQERR